MRTKFCALVDSDIVVDANTLIDFQELSVLNLPVNVFSNVFIPSNILRKELDDDFVKDLLALGYQPIDITTNKGYEMLFGLAQKFSKPSECDRVLISIAYETGLICCSNDQPVRKVCDSFGISLAGSLGIMCAALEKDIITKLDLAQLLHNYGIITSAHIKESLKDDISALYNLPRLDQQEIV